jgi:hypothetical protein
MNRECVGATTESVYRLIRPSVGMYADMRKMFWWKDMKKDIAGHVARCVYATGLSQTPETNWFVEAT